LVVEFYRKHEANLAAPFLLYGSGDFHYLAALRLRGHDLPVLHPVEILARAHGLA